MLALAATAMLGLGGCLSLPGPSAAYPASKEEVKSEWSRMKASPVGLERPLLVMDGWVVTGGGDTIARELTELTGAGPDDVLLEKYRLGGTPETLVARTIRHVEAKWPSGDPKWTTEVDAVGFSNGGLLHRLGALPPQRQDAEPRKRLRIRRLFTVSSPHRGVRFGIGRVGIDASARAVQPARSSWSTWTRTCPTRRTSWFAAPS